MYIIYKQIKFLLNIFIRTTDASIKVFKTLNVCLFFSNYSTFSFVFYYFISIILIGKNILQFESCPTSEKILVIYTKMPVFIPGLDTFHTVEKFPNCMSLFVYVYIFFWINSIVLYKYLISFSKSCNMRSITEKSRKIIIYSLIFARVQSVNKIFSRI